MDENARPFASSVGWGRKVVLISSKHAAAKLCMSVKTLRGHRYALQAGRSALVRQNGRLSGAGGRDVNRLTVPFTDHPTCRGNLRNFAD